jgi:hypothetical protein
MRLVLSGRAVSCKSGPGQMPHCVHCSRESPSGAAVCLHCGARPATGPGLGTPRSPGVLPDALAGKLSRGCARGRGRVRPVFAGPRPGPGSGAANRGAAPPSGRCSQAARRFRGAVWGVEGGGASVPGRHTLARTIGEADPGFVQTFARDVAGGPASAGPLRVRSDRPGVRGVDGSMGAVCCVDGGPMRDRAGRR